MAGQARCGRPPDPAMRGCRRRRSWRHAPNQRNQRLKMAPRIPKQPHELVDRPAECCVSPVPCHGSRPGAAHKSLKHWPSEWANVVDSRRRIMRIAERDAFGCEQAVADNLEKQLLIVAWRQASDGVAPRIKDRWPADRVAREDVGRDGEDDGAGTQDASRSSIEMRRSSSDIASTGMLRRTLARFGKLAATGLRSR